MFYRLARKVKSIKFGHLRVDPARPNRIVARCMTAPEQANPPADGSSQGKLRRVLGLGDLIFYGIVLIQPVGVVGIYGLADQKSFGHISATILIALVAMMLTAASYGRMAGLYPVGGSAYVYVSRGLNPHLGFLAGWAMFLDYLAIPVVSIIFGALSARSLTADFAPALAAHSYVHFIFWVILFIAIVTTLNLFGIKWTAGANLILTVIMFLVIGIFVVDAVRFLLHRDGFHALFSIKPFYDRATFHILPVATATSLAALTYIGFDGITTLTEEAREPKTTVPRAVVLVCLLIGLCAVIQTYLGQLVWPDFSKYKDPDTAFFDVCMLVGGKFLFYAFSITMVVACLGSALAGQVGAARILYGMGRDGALPAFFARLDKRNNPALNIWLVSALALVGSLTLSYEHSADLINFGAFMAFMAVNAAVIREFVFRPPAGHRRNFIFDLIVPGLGFVICAILWWQLPPLAKQVGGTWCVVGMVYAAIKTNGFRRAPAMIDLSGS